MSESTTGSVAANERPAIVPSHGRGMLRPWRPGERGNPTGKLGEYHAVRRLCADHSLDAAKRLIALTTDTDTRVAFMAIKEVLERGIGKARDHADEQGGHIDLSALSPDERQAMVEMLKKAMGL